MREDFDEFANDIVGIILAQALPVTLGQNGSRRRGQEGSSNCEESHFGKTAFAKAA